MYSANHVPMISNVLWMCQRDIRLGIEHPDDSLATLRPETLAAGFAGFSESIFRFMEVILRFGGAS